jgi:hypothetical protein
MGFEPNIPLLIFTIIAAVVFVALFEINFQLAPGVNSLNHPYQLLVFAVSCGFIQAGLGEVQWFAFSLLAAATVLFILFWVKRRRSRGFHGKYSCRKCGSTLFNADLAGFPGLEHHVFRYPYQNGQVKAVLRNLSGQHITQAQCAQCGVGLGLVVDKGPSYWLLKIDPVTIGYSHDA